MTLSCFELDIYIIFIYLNLNAALPALFTKVSYPNIKAERLHKPSVSSTLLLVPYVMTATTMSISYETAYSYCHYYRDCHTIPTADMQMRTAGDSEEQKPSLSSLINLTYEYSRFHSTAVSINLTNFGWFNLNKCTH